ncbi:arylamine N-acetyltransferase [Nocardiopsis halophila]|uniref:arylamine N-acetyltransferase n=1 Tax=Nocardiopsis halophila TaxID=141692 RepID=UPI000348DEAA|nr:arylamine N-acetyltransferase [Nocardiopsis halophila]
MSPEVSRRLWANRLLAMVLGRIGVRATGHLGRIRVGGRFTPATHMLLDLDVVGERLVADVGFGGGGVIEPKPRAAGSEAKQGEWTHRLEPGDARAVGDVAVRLGRVAWIRAVASGVQVRPSQGRGESRPGCAVERRERSEGRARASRSRS